MPTWKSILLKAAGFGAGSVVALSIVVASWLWYTSRPRPWNKDAMKAKFSGLGFQARHEAFVMEFEYSVENTTNKDYTFPSDISVFRRQQHDAGYASYFDAEVVGNVFIPAKHTMNIKIRVPYKYEDLNTTFEKDVDDKRTDLFAFRRLNRLDSFALFDKQNKYEIDLPNGWAEWDKGKDAFK